VATNSKIETVFPTRGVAGGWRDVWDESDDSAELQAQTVAAVHRQLKRADRLGQDWRAEILAERRESTGSDPRGSGAGVTRGCRRGAATVPAPADCSDVTAGASIFIGHDCGEWSSVVIAGNIIICKPWSRAISASRAVRIRTARGTKDVSVTPSGETPGDSQVPVSGNCHPDYIECLPADKDVDCGDPALDAYGGIVHFRDPNNDDYRLDVSRGDGNGIGCDDESKPRSWPGSA
jgi:hypothetical protein